MTWLHLAGATLALLCLVGASWAYTRNRWVSRFGATPERRRIAWHMQHIGLGLIVFAALAFTANVLAWWQLR